MQLNELNGLHGLNGQGLQTYRTAGMSEPKIMAGDPSSCGSSQVVIKAGGMKLKR